ncbi:hypothetical protein HZH66_006434 [Vespula vulgaris]|uniref:Uncharacterized protein n=1 Tax=Vespula vulgaris TaxID=7454 RepID=A0A834N6Z8_VESVU|nr:hypothetical protein HZH66_006434 [Vespula vulgaris]
MPGATGFVNRMKWHPYYELSTAKTKTKKKTTMKRRRNDDENYDDVHEKNDEKLFDYMFVMSVSLGVSKCVEPMKSAKRYEISLIGEWRPPLVMNTDEPTTNIFLLERNRQPSTDYSICSTAD